MKKGILSALVLTMALAPTAVGVNAHYDSTLRNSTINTVLKEQKLTVEEAKKQMDAAKEALDAAEAEANAKNEYKNNVSTSLTQMEANFSQAVEDMASLEKELEDLGKKVNELETEMSKNGNVVEEQGYRKSALEAAFPTVKQDYEVAKSALDDQMALINDLEDRLSKENRKDYIEGFKNQIAREKALLPALNDAYMLASIKYTEHEEGIKQCTQAIDYAKRQIEALNIEKESATNEINNLKGAIESKKADMQFFNEQILVLKENVRNAEIDASKANDAYELAKSEYEKAKATYEKLVAEQDKPVDPKPEAKPENKPVNKPAATWDDGGPFTTNAEGDVFDRWGNLIYDAPAKAHSSNGYTMVNTSDR